MKKIRSSSEVLDNCIEHLLAGNENIDQFLDNCPKQQAEVKSLIRLTLDIRRVSMTMSSANVKERVKNQFCLALAEMNPKRKTWNLSHRLKLSIATALLLAFTVCILGISTYHSMPGYLLHPVRLAFEEAWLIQTPIGIAKAEKHALLADRRITEIIYLIKNGYKLEKLEQVTQLLYYHLATIESLAATDTVMMKHHKVTVEEIIQEENSAETKLPDKITSDETDAESAQIHATTAYEKDYQLLAAEKTAKWLQFKTTLEQQADNHLNKLHKLSPMIPETVRSDLLIVVSIVEDGYIRTIKNLEASLKTSNP